MADPNELAIVVCPRVTDVPDPLVDSTTDICSNCIKTVHVAGSSFHILERPGARILCTICAIDHIKSYENRGEKIQVRPAWEEEE